jgi:Na+/H+ antiporter NhaD/arsenite permease-like protein
MLWIGGQVTTANLIRSLFLPSLVSMAVPFAVICAFLKGPVETPGAEARADGPQTTRFEKNVMFGLGLGSLVFVPVFKAGTHLPPYLGILFSLGVLWLVGELLHRRKTDEEKECLTLAKALRRIDMASITFFIGILLAVAVLSANGQLATMASWLGRHVASQRLIAMIIGLVSAVVDNIPLVAAAMGMYPLHLYPQDCFLWEMIANCAGTGGSILVIGSAAGVAAMGIEKIQYAWYAKRVTPLALLGYLAGTATYLLQHRLAGG